MRGASYLSPNLLWLYRAVGEHLDRRLGSSVDVVQGACAPLTDPDLLAIAGICSFSAACP